MPIDESKCLMIYHEELWQQARMQEVFPPLVSSFEFPTIT